MDSSIPYKGASGSALDGSDSYVDATATHTLVTPPPTSTTPLLPPAAPLPVTDVTRKVLCVPPPRPR